MTWFKVQNPIKRRKWEAFVKHPDLAVLLVVREFYANAIEHRNYHAFVRGKWVPFDRTTINQYYGLSDIDNDDYQEMVGGDLNWETVKDVMCKSPCRHLILSGLDLNKDLFSLNKESDIRLKCRARPPEIQTLEKSNGNIM